MKGNSLFIVLQKMRTPFLVIIVTYTISIIGLLLIDGIDKNGNTYHMSIFDAFYFISYTATTIGFGETPYTFTYAQRIWVNFSIYLTVLGWFYAIGSLVNLLQDKTFLKEIARSKFRRQVSGIKQKFIIVLGYNQITNKIIKKALENEIRTIVIEKDQEKVNSLILESYTPTVPVLNADVSSSISLEEAGIKSKYCRGIISIFEDDSLNLRIALISKLLNPHVKLASKSTTNNHTQNLKDLDVELIANPFSIISNEISMALIAPNLLKLEKWIYNLENLTSPLPLFPKGKYIVCGYGRMGQHIYKQLKEKNVEVQFVEIDKRRTEDFNSDELMKIKCGNADDKDLLLEVGIENSVAIISATDDDTTNLSVIATAKKLNPKIMTIVRENEMEDLEIFKNAKADHVFIPSTILINKITNALLRPLSDKFIDKVHEKDDKWASKLIKELVKKIGADPILFELKINKKHSPQIIAAIDRDEIIELKIFSKSLYNKEQNNNVLPLMLLRGNEIKLLPLEDEKIEENDQILFACDENAKNDIEYITQNIYEFYYVFTGKEKKTIFVRNKDK